MNPVLHQVSKRGVDHALPFDTVSPSERSAFDVQREMTLARWIVAGMAPVLLAVVDQFYPRL